jgi:hypothetical protein
MSDIHSTNDNYVEFYLQSEFNFSLKLKSEPLGWNEDDIKLTRHKEYHGIVTEYTQDLTFFDDAIDYINNAYKAGGINTNLYLIKRKLDDSNDEVKFVEEYSLLADFKTKKEENNGLKIRFNSNELEEIIKSHETDTFEIERLLSIDNENLDALELFKVQLTGRTIAGVGESKLNLDFQTVELGGIKYQGTVIRENLFTTAVTLLVSEGSSRHSSVDILWDGDDASKMFFVHSVTEGETANLKINYDVEFLAGSFDDCNIKSYFRILEWNGLSYDEILLDELNSSDIPGDQQLHQIKFNGYKEYTLQYNQGIMLCHKSSSAVGIFLGADARFKKQNIKINFYEFYENSPSLSCTFVHDCVERLMYIMTGKKGLFKSNYFGRTELGYSQDGEGSLIGLISGFWARAFDPASEKYKSLQISLKDIIISVQAVFNIGVTIETNNLQKIIRFEELSYFYRDRPIIKLPNQLSNVVRTVDKELFFSGAEFGFEQGGNYNNEVGLDEPNVRTETVTPIRKSTLKYRRVSKIRGDDTGLELTRRKPQLLFPEDDTAEDEHNWFLDLKRTLGGYTQKIWSDRLQELPTGINSPEDFKGMLFTPLRMLLRHGLILKSGLEPYFDKFIMYANSISNRNLSMLFINETKSYKENSNILVNDLPRSKFEPEIIEGEHDIDDSLMRLIKGSTKVLINGVYEDVPNLYFPIEFINEKEEIERGYFLELERKSGKFKFQKTNENLIKTI